MPQKTVTDAKGLFTNPNQLSKVPDGATVVANNVICDRDGMYEPRRGFGQYASEFGVPDDRAKQLLSYKNRLLVHFGSTLMFNANANASGVDGDFQAFDGSYDEVSPGLRIKGIESNGNFFFTTADGIKKISAETASDLSTAAGYIIDAGGIKALDVTGSPSGSGFGFLPADSAVAYRVVWGYRDANDNLILGSPSSRLVVKNFSDNSTNVDLEFVIPSTVVEDVDFYQIYRTGIFTATNAITLSDIDPGDEMNLIIEDFPTSVEITASLVESNDITPDDFRAGGTPLYTNPNSGEGINQANEPPPKSSDITKFQNTTFYSNIQTRARQELDMLSVQDIVDGDTITITSNLGVETYTFRGETEISNIDFGVYTGTVPGDLDGKSFNINSASNTRKYYVWYDNTKTTQTLDFTNYVGDIPPDLDGSFVVFYTNSDRTYYIWFASTGSILDPGLSNSVLEGMIGLKIDTSSLTSPDTPANLTALMKTQLDALDVFDDFDTVDNVGSLDIETESFASEGIVDIETIALGFDYSILTPPNADPDPADRFPIRVNISRNITTNVHVADATAAAILDQDNASDFDVTYPSTSGSNLGLSTEAILIETTQNGNVTNATDVDIADSFAIAIDQQGDGEDSALNDILLSSAPTASQQIDESARSIVNIVNKNTTSAVNAFYLSGPTDIPGQILLESRDVGTPSFYLNASTALTGNSFNPAIPTTGETVKGKSESKPNRIVYSKLQQPEATPLLNFIDVGAKDKPISRILALRESLFILKEDGVYRLTGFNGNFTVDLFDESTKILAPDTAVVLNNQIYCLANNGIVTISDTGVQIISGRLDNIIQGSSTISSVLATAAFGVAYETDRAYLLFTPNNKLTTTANTVIRHRYDTDTWTSFPIAKTCGLVIQSDDKLYLGPADENFIEQERKDFSRTDYADRRFTLNIPQDSVDGTSVTLSQPNIAKVGDALLQTQYLTIAKYNQILMTLDLDNSVDSDYFSILAASPGDNLKDKVDSLALKLDADPNPADSDYFSSVQSYFAIGSTIVLGDPTVVTEVGHGLNTGRVVTISNSTSTPSIDGIYVVTKIDDDNFSIDIETTVGGTCDWAANTSTFQEVQGMFNALVNKINLDTNIARSNYPLSEGSVEFEDIVVVSTTNTNNVSVQFNLPFIEGPIDVYKGIECELLYTPETFGDASVLKQVTEGTFMFENNNFTRATVGYKTDLSPGIETIEFNKSGKGDWSNFIWSSQNWGGGFASIPLRTYIPRQKQRCRHVQGQFIHTSARESWAVTGFSYTFRGISEKAYRG